MRKFDTISERYLDENYDMKKHSKNMGGKRTTSQYRSNGKKRRKEQYDASRKNKYAERFVNDYDDKD